MKIIDLTMPLSEETPVFPDDPKPRFESCATLENVSKSFFP